MADVSPDEQGLFTIPDDLGDTADLSEAVVVPDVPKYLMPDKVYDVLKWLCILALPAIGWAYGELAPDWGWPDANKVCHALDVVGTVVGVLIGASQFSAMGR